MEQVMEISKSDLAGARDTNNNEFLATTFKKAEEVIKAGGAVHLMQIFSDASKEIAEVVDNLDHLARIRDMYVR